MPIHLRAVLFMVGEIDGKDSVLIPTGFDSKTYACVRSLAARGIHTIIASEYEDVPVSTSRFCDESIVVPSPLEGLAPYRDALLEIAARPDVQTIVPTRSIDPYLFSNYRMEFEQYVTLPTLSLETLRTVHDRIRLVRAAEEAGVPVPRTQRFGDVEDWNAELIIKSRYNLLVEAYVDGYVSDQSETIKAIKHLKPGEKPDLELIRSEYKHEPIVQQYVRSDDEYLFGALYDHGEALTTFQHRQVRGDSYTGGGGVFRETVNIPELEETGRMLLDHLDFHGLACVEYMKDANTGEFVLTEINPRMWQSIPCAVQAGADFPYYYWLLATGRTDNVGSGYELGVGSHQLYGELGHLLSIRHEESPLVDKPSLLRTAWEILSSCYEMPRFDMLRREDPLPFLHSVAFVLKQRQGHTNR